MRRQHIKNIQRARSNATMRRFAPRRSTRCVCVAFSWRLRWISAPLACSLQRITSIAAVHQSVSPYRTNTVHQHVRTLTTIQGVLVNAYHNLVGTFHRRKITARNTEPTLYLIYQISSGNLMAHFSIGP